MTPQLLGGNIYQLMIWTNKGSGSVLQTKNHTMKTRSTMDNMQCFIDEKLNAEGNKTPKSQLPTKLGSSEKMQLSHITEFH
jgi:hypothetical protein